MKMRTFVGLCAALAFVAGSPGAHALKIFDAAPAGRAALTAGTDSSFTYASETLLTTAANVTEVKGDSTKYYNVGGTGTVVLSMPGDVGANVGDTYIVSIVLDGMVFRTVPTVAALDEDTALADATFSVATGGASGDKSAVFRLTGGGINAASAIVNVTASFAVSAGGGSATVTLANQSLAALNIPGVSGTMTHGPTNVIKVASALKETPMASDLTASVESSFKKFTDGMTVGHVGSMTVGLNAGYRNATDSAGATPVDGLNDILQLGQTTATPPAANSSVSFMGDFSFASKVFVHGDNDCGADDETAGDPGAGTDTNLASAETDIRVMEGTGDDAVVTNTTMAVNLDATPADTGDDDTTASVTNYLCIMVQGDDTDDKEAPRIPNTDAYTAMGSYTALENAASGPMGMQRMLGEINRDGTTVHLPYLTTHDRYSQRLRIVNRSSVNARYEMEFHGADDEAGDMATGMLDENSITVMNLRDGMVVTPGNGSSTSGTLIVEANSGDIDVATIQVNRELGTSDTVVYTAE